MKKKEKPHHLDEKPYNRGQQRSPPAAEEKGRSEAAEHDDVDVLADEEKPEAHAGVFRVETGDQFPFRFGEVERDSPTLGGNADQKITKASGWQKMNHTPACALTISESRNERASITVGTSDSPIDSS